MFYFDENSEEVKNAKQICSRQDIYRGGPFPVSEEVLIKSVTTQLGNKYSKGIKPNWRAEMFEIETDIGVYITAKGRQKDQNNPTLSNGQGGDFADWMEHIGKRVKVITGPCKRPDVKFSWIYYIW